MKKQAQNSLDRMKLLMEFHFKPNSNKDSVNSVVPVNDEQPVKFNEVGDTYKYQEEEHDYPSYDEYRDNVMIDEEDPQPEEQPQNGTAQPAPEQNAAPQTIPAGQEPPQSSQPPMPDGGSNPAAPMPAPAQTAPIPAPTPEPMPQAAPVDPMYSALEASLQKTDDMLAKFDMLQQQLSGMESVNMKLNDVEKKLEDLKNPPYDEQLEMISKKAYPYNIKLSDFWGWDKEENEKPEEKEFKLSPDDFNSYNKEDIKKSFQA